MKYLLISDVHANDEALRAVIDDTTRFGGFDRVLVAGDIVGYGVEPNEVCERLMGLDAIVVGGNHDHAANGWLHLGYMHGDAAECLRRNRDALDERFAKWLKTAPDVYEEGRDRPLFSMVHGSPRDPADHHYIFAPAEVVDAANYMDGKGVRARVVLHGHTHVPRAWTVTPPSLWEISESTAGKISIKNANVQNHLSELTPVVEFNAFDPTKLALLNPGSTGQPRDQDWRSSYMLMDVNDDTGNITVTHHRVAYDWEKFVHKMLDNKYPSAMAWRLAPAEHKIPYVGPRPRLNIPKGNNTKTKE